MSLEKMLNVFSVLYVTRTLSNGTINGAINALLPFNCTKRTLSVFRQLHVVCFTCGHDKIKGMSYYTRWTCSQSLTVVERAISDLQA